MADRREYSRDDVIGLAVAAADRNGLDRAEFLGGVIAEGLDVYAERPTRQEDWRRYWEPPDPRFDVSFGLGQKNVRYSAEYAAWCRAQGFEPTDPRADAYPGDEVIASIREAYFDPAHALDVAARGYRYWRYDPPVSALQAWVAYNGPSYYRRWQESPNLENYRDGLAQAARILGESTMPTIPFNPDAPVDVQPNDWSCSLQSLQWLLRSIGRNPDANDPTGDPWLTSQLVPGIIRPDVGLLDASGAQLAAWINREYGSEMGFEAHYANPVTFDDVAAGAGVNPTLIGGRAWNHWVGVRGLRSDGALRLANPAPGFKGVDQLLTRQQFDVLGPFSAVYIDRAAMGVGEPPPADPLAPLRAWKQEGLDMLDEDDREFRDRLRAWVERMPV